MKEYKDIDLKYIMDAAHSIYISATTILSKDDASLLKMDYVALMTAEINKKGGKIDTVAVEQEILKRINNKFIEEFEKMKALQAKDDEEIVYSGPVGMGGVAINLTKDE